MTTLLSARSGKRIAALVAGVVLVAAGLTGVASPAAAAAAPKITVLSPTTGPSNGGTAVTIHGSGFSGVKSVMFGSAAAHSFSVVSSSAITAVSPAHGATAVKVEVITAAGPSASTPGDVFTYVGKPTITLLSPKIGPTAGGTHVIISGSQFIGVTSVMFGSAKATHLQVLSATKISVTATPAHGATGVKVAITARGGTSASTASDVYTYTAGPYITDLPLQAGPIAGGEKVTILGSGFTKVKQVMFGSATATSYTVKNSQTIVAVAPAHGATVVRVEVVTATATTPSVVTDVFTYGPFSATTAPLPPPKQGDNAFDYNDLSCSGSTFCVAVGDLGQAASGDDEFGTDPGRAFIDTRVGGTWTAALAPMPETSGTITRSSLTNVDCVSTTSCAAIGFYSGSDFHGVVLESFDGTSWTAQAAPTPDDTVDNAFPASLNSVSCDAPGSCVAVGLYDGQTSSVLAETLSDGGWTASTLPLPSDAEAIGSIQINGEISTVSCGQAGSCVAVGSYRTTKLTRGLIETWSGGEWSAAASPLPAGAPGTGSLNQVSCAGEVCAATGSWSNADSFDTAMLVTLSSGNWHAVTTPLPAGGSALQVNLIGVSCVASGTCRAAGDYIVHGKDAPLVETWSGGSWSPTALPVPYNLDQANTDSAVLGISCATSSSCLVVMNYYANFATNERESELYSLTSSGWTGSEAPLPANLGATPRPYLTDVSCGAAGSCVAMGSYTGAGHVGYEAFIG